MQLKKTVKDMLKSEGKAKYIDEIKDLFKFYQENYIKKFTPVSVRPKSLIGQNCMVFLQTNLFRTKMLAKGYIDGLNKQNAIVSTLSLRAYFETTGALALLFKKYNQYSQETISEEELSETLGSLYLGVKSKGEELFDAPDPINVMNLIDAVDYFLRTNYEIGDKKFRKSYDALSEVCHPNAFSYMLGHKVDRRYTIHFTGDSEPLDPADYYVEYFSITTNLYRDIYTKLRKKVEENEELPFIEYHPSMEKL